MVRLFDRDLFAGGETTSDLAVVRFDEVREVFRSGHWTSGRHSEDGQVGGQVLCCRAGGDGVPVAQFLGRGRKVDTIACEGARCLQRMTFEAFRPGLERVPEVQEPSGRYSRQRGH